MYRQGSPVNAGLPFWTLGSRGDKGQSFALIPFRFFIMLPDGYASIELNILAVDWQVGMEK